MGLDLNRGLRLCLSRLRSWCLPLLTLGLGLSIQHPDLGLHQLLLLRRHSDPTLAELLLNGGESLLLRDVYLASYLWLSNPIRELESSSVNGGSLDCP